MNYWWLVSGGIGLLTALVHLIGGQLEVIKPFLQCDLAAVPKATLHACWHMVTVILFASAIALLYSGVNPYSLDHADMPRAAYWSAGQKAGQTNRKRTDSDGFRGSPEMSTKLPNIVRWQLQHCLLLSGAAVVM